MKLFRLLIYCFFVFQSLYAQSTIKNDIKIVNQLLLKATSSVESNLTKTKEYASKAMELLYKNNSIYDRRMIEAYNLVAYVEKARNNANQAKSFLQNALSIQDRIKKDHEDLILTHFFMARIKQDEKKYTVAIKHYKKTLYLIKNLHTQKNYTSLKKEAKNSIDDLLPLAKKEIVYNEYSFLDFVNQVKDNYPNISIQEFINNKNEHNKSIECMLKLCKKLIPKYLEVDTIYSKYLKNPSQTKENLFDFVKITNFNYLLDTVGVCILNYSDKNTTQQKLVVESLYKDISKLLRNSKNPIELDVIAFSYKKFYKIISELSYSPEFVKYNKYLSKTEFFNKLQVYKDIQLKEQDPKLVPTIPESKKKLLFKRYEYFEEYFNEYFLTMEKIIQDNDYIRWDKYFYKLSLLIKNKNTIIADKGEEGRAKIWAAGVILYFKSTLDNYNILLKTYTALNKINKY